MKQTKNERHRKHYMLAKKYTACSQHFTTAHLLCSIVGDVSMEKVSMHKIMDFIGNPTFLFFFYNCGEAKTLQKKSYSW